MGTWIPFPNHTVLPSSSVPSTPFELSLKAWWDLFLSLDLATLLQAASGIFALFGLRALNSMAMRLLSWVTDIVQEYFCVSASFNERDPSYEWMLCWISAQKEWESIRTMAISTSINGGNILPAHYFGETSYNVGGVKQTIYALPELGKTYKLNNNGRLVTIHRRVDSNGGSFPRKTECNLDVRIFMANPKAIYELVQEARELFVSSQKNTIDIYHPDKENVWRLLGSRAKRPLSSVVLDRFIKERILADAKEFLGCRSWYAERGIPYRRGFLFHGKPGTGKTSLIQCLAAELELDIYTLSLARAGMDDRVLSDLVTAIPEKSILLMEDIDAALAINVINREDEKTDANSNETQKKVGVSLGGLLNIIDGVGAPEGRILIATTNYYDRLDEALHRPGRMDLKVEFTLASRHQARELFRVFYLPQPVMGTMEVSRSKHVGISLVNLDSHEDAGSFSAASPDKRTDSDVAIARRFSKLYFEGQNMDTEEFFEVFGELADQFAEALPEEGFFSTAALQNYLLMHKTDPSEAANAFAAWAMKEKEEREEKEEGRTRD